MRKRFFALLLYCLLLLPTLAFAQGEELLSENALAGGNTQGWFEEAWYTAGDEYAILADTEQDAVCIRNYVENDARLCYTLQVKGNKYYKLSCDVRTLEVEGGAGANVSVNGTMASSEPILGTQDWQRISLSGKTGKKQTELTVCVRVGGYGALSSGTAWFRNASLVEIDRTGAAADFAPAEIEAEEDITAGKVPYFGTILLSCLFTTVMFVFFSRLVIEKKENEASISENAALTVLLCAALLLRVLLSKLIYGHPTDIQCFMAWGNAMAEGGAGAFYTSGMFADYPPGYMLVLGAMAKIASALGFEYASDAYALIIKLPAILCDIASAYFVYRIARRKFSARSALCIAALVAFNPLLAFISGGWGQIDSVLTLLLVLSIWLFLEDKLIVAGAVYGLAILIKPQALMLGPIMATAYFCRIDGKKTVLRTVAAVAAAFAVIFLFALPFKSTQETGWLFEKYFSTAISYPYGSIEAYNLMALLGGNWANVDTPVLFFTYRTLGTLLMCAVVAASCLIYIRARKEKGALWLCAAYLLCGLFVLGQYMHERYLIPMLLLLLMGMIETRDRRVYTLFAFFTITLLFNTAGAFVIIDHPEGRALQYDLMTRIGAAFQLGGFVYFSNTLYRLLLKKETVPAFVESEQKRISVAMDAEPFEPLGGRLFTRKDRWLCWGLTVLYAIVALVNLGSLKSPQSAWSGQDGDEVVLDFGEEVQLGDVWVFGGIAEGRFTFTPDAGEPLSYEQTFDDMFRWAPLPYGIKTRYLHCRVEQGSIVMQELAFHDANGKLLRVSGDTALTDEQSTVPENISYLNSMYFDELYHGRTAYEHLHGMEPYENSHPPLGKILIMAGIALFGMCPFGWRISGCLLGIAMLPILYAFAKRLFRKSEYAFLATALFACDFMHYTQTRIATIDVYAVFFILLMYDFMYQYTCTDFLQSGVKKTLKPLALAGLFFGLGAASKWTCIYAGGGLAIMLLLHLVREYGESKRLLADKSVSEQEKGATYRTCVIQTLLWCCLFYILVPVLIYLLSYLPYVLSVKHYDLKGIWGVQEFMLNYHSTLKATHPYQSAWWQWPLDLRPTWYYVGYDATGANAGTISAFGNPLVWWVCSAGMLVLLVRLLRGKLRVSRESSMLAVAAAANYLPWVLVPRCTFTYHYFPMTPFIILASMLLLKEADARHPEYKYWKWLWLLLCAALFILFFPVISGNMVPLDYIFALEWLPSWTFLGY